MNPTLILSLAVLALPFALTASTNSGDTPHYRSYFYVGGAYTALATNASELVHTGQMYVERLTPTSAGRSRAPILLLHGNAQTGANFLNTPDGRPGWASHFLAAGHTVVLPDQVFRGRSPTPPGYQLASYPAEYIVRQFTSPYGWPQARLHTQWPGDGVPGDAVFDAYFASTAPFEGNNTLQQLRMRTALVELVSAAAAGFDDDVVVVAHSQAGLFAWALADEVPAKIKALVMLEPSGPPFREAVTGRRAARRWGLTDIPLRYDPPVVDPETELKVVEIGRDTPANASCFMQQEGTVRSLEKLKDVPVLLVTGEASYHAVYDHCTMDFLRQAGVKVEFMKLWEKGQRGNGHMFIMEKNSREVWKLVEDWITKLK